MADESGDGLEMLPAAAGGPPSTGLPGCRAPGVGGAQKVLCTSEVHRLRYIDTLMCTWLQHAVPCFTTSRRLSPSVGVCASHMV